MKSPLRVPSREFKCLSLLKGLIPLDSVVHSFLMFDGGLEIALSHDGRYVVGHTNKYVIHEFWRCVQENPQRLAEVAEYFQPIEDENIFYLLQENWPKYHDPYIRSALFLLLNRYSENGQISSGQFNPERYRPTDLLALKRVGFRNLHLILDLEDDFLDSIRNIKGRCDTIVVPMGSYSFNYLEEGKPEGFEDTKVYHKETQKLLEETDQRMVLIYKSTPMVEKVYKDSNLYFVDQWGRQAKDSSQAVEVLVANF